MLIKSDNLIAHAQARATRKAGPQDAHYEQNIAGSTCCASLAYSIVGLVHRYEVLSYSLTEIGR